MVTIYEADEPKEDLVVTDIDTGFSHGIRFDEDQLAAQREVQDAVGTDTAMTTPTDMGVKPDRSLLQEYGLAEADDDDDASGVTKQRPSGGQRFGDYNTWVETGHGGVVAEQNKEQSNSGYPDWRAATSPVAKDKFEIEPFSFGDHSVPLPNIKTGCFLIEKTGVITCHIDSLYDLGFKQRVIERHNAANTSVQPVMMLEVASGRDNFFLYPGIYESPLGGYSSVPPLAAGESVKIGRFECFNLGDTAGCESETTSFYVNSDGEIFLDKSPLPLGAHCGEVTHQPSGQRFDVVVAGGSIDCVGAVPVAQELVDTSYLNPSATNTLHDVKGWSCAADNEGMVGAYYKLGDCYQDEELRNSVEIRLK